MKICVITGSRSEYDRLSPVLREIKRNGLHLDLVAINSHLSPIHGLSINEIKKDGFKIADQVEMLLSSSSCAAISKSVGIGIMGLAGTMARLKPDIVLILGDRTELLSVAVVCICQNLIIGHICGGEITEGAVDDSVRHMMTKASHLHFPANDIFADRIRQMGEEDWRICVSGSPALDKIKTMEFITRKELESCLDLDLSKKTALVTYHPVTLEIDRLRHQMKNLISALTAQKIQYVITYPNSDVGSHYIIQEFKRFQLKNKERVRLVKNLGVKRFLSLMKYVAFMAGNSSSGIVEAPSFNLPVVNIGSRQSGRVFAKNIISTGYDAASILRGFKKAELCKHRNCQNPYGDMNASSKIVNFIKEIFNRCSKSEILRKKFVVWR